MCRGLGVNCCWEGWYKSEKPYGYLVWVSREMAPTRVRRRSKDSCAVVTPYVHFPTDGRDKFLRGKFTVSRIFGSLPAE